MPDDVLVERVGAVAVVRLNRPDRRNAFNAAMGRALSAAYEECDGDDAVRAVVLTGTPPAFCAGADLSASERTFADPGAGFQASGISFPAWRVRKPVIAAVNGHAIGIGLTLALQCDIRVMADDAKYGVVQARKAVVGDAYSHWVLPRLVGISRAAEILLTGATFDGRRAYDLGLCSQVLAPDRVLDAAHELAADLAENTAPLSVAASKELLWSSFDLDRAEVGRRETSIHLDLMAHEDVLEAGRAHAEKRAPAWTGRVSSTGPITT